MPNRRTIILGGAIVTALVLLTVFLVQALQSRIGSSASAEGAEVFDLPAGATDIEWYLPFVFSPHTLYEFTVDEAGYERWVRNRSRPKLEGPKPGSFEILRYDRATDALELRWLTNTIAYTWSEEDRGVYLVYDLDAGRAYFWSHSR